MSGRVREGSCDFCGRPFVDRSGAQRRRFCSGRCRRSDFETKMANRVPCAACGGPTGNTPGQKRGDGRPEGERLCRACDEAGRRAVADERGRRIQRWWAEGLSTAEIAVRLGWSKNHLSAELDRLRRRGFDLPYRYHLSRPRYPELNR